MTRKRTRRHAGPAEPSRLLTRMMFVRDASTDAPLPDDRLRTLAATMHSAVENISRGRHPGEDDWRDISDAVNVLETLWMRGHLVKPEVEPAWKAACAALARTGEHWRRHHVMRMDAPGLTAVRERVDYYVQALEGLPERAIRLAFQETRERLQDILHGRMPTDRQVVVV